MATIPPGKSPISYLQERCTKRGITPQYDLVANEGAVHEPTFIIRVTVGEISATGKGSSKKKAKHNAAQSALKQVLGVPNGNAGNASRNTEIKPAPVAGDDPLGNPVGELQELTQKKHMKPPTYEFTSEPGTPHARGIMCIVKIQEKGSARSKKTAKRIAAQNMLNHFKNSVKEGVSVLPPSTMDRKSAFLDGFIDLKIGKPTTAQPSESSFSAQDHYLGLPDANWLPASNVGGTNIDKESLPEKFERPRLPVQSEEETDSYCLGVKLHEEKELKSVDQYTQGLASQSQPQNSCTSGDSIIDMAGTPCSGKEKPLTFQTRVATPKLFSSHTLDRAMEMSTTDPPKPLVPGLTPMDQEVITKQPDECDAYHDNAPPTLYCENVHWMKGRELGKGSFGTCYLARDNKTGILMAVKQMRIDPYSTKQQSAIEEEIHLMEKLDHPHIVRILGAKQQGCVFNMFLEWMSGGSVADLLKQYGKFSEVVITSYSLQLLRGLTYLHENHVLHRDLKGANLLIDSSGQRLRIGDFGVAARLASNSTGDELKGQWKGTIPFMAPEVIRGERYRPACDVWSAGCCLIEMATTKHPWNNELETPALIYKIGTAQSPPLIPKKLSRLLRDLLLRCLEPVKEQRPSARELLIHPLFKQKKTT